MKEEKRKREKQRKTKQETKQQQRKHKQKNKNRHLLIPRFDADILISKYFLTVTHFISNTHHPLMQLFYFS